jgi:hypothetical protein
VFLRRPASGDKRCSAADTRVRAKLHEPVVFSGSLAGSDAAYGSITDFSIYSRSLKPANIDVWRTTTFVVVNPCSAAFSMTNFSRLSEILVIGEKSGEK